jgi:hypothetical protein
MAPSGLQTRNEGTKGGRAMSIAATRSLSVRLPSLSVRLPSLSVRLPLAHDALKGRSVFGAISRQMSSVGAQIDAQSDAVADREGISPADLAKTVRWMRGALRRNKSRTATRLRLMLRLLSQVGYTWAPVRELRALVRLQGLVPSYPQDDARDERREEAPGDPLVLTRSLVMAPGAPSARFAAAPCAFLT